MATLFENWCTADGGTDISGTVTLTAVVQQSAGELTLATVPQPITVTAGAFSEAVTPGEYLVDVELHAGADEVRISTDRATQRINVADTPTPQRLRELIDLGVVGTSPLAKLNAVVASWLDTNVNTEVSQALINEALTDPESAPRQALDAAYAPKWQPSTAYLAGAKVISPTTGDVISRNANGSSRPTFDATEQGLWTAAYTTPAFIRRDRPMAATDPIFNVDAAGTSNATAAIQALLDEALVEKRIVEFPRGWYRITRITCPSKVKVFGHGLGGFGSNAAEASTYFIHEAGATGPMIVFTGNPDGGRINIGPIHLGGLVLRGNPANTDAWAISFEGADGTLGTIQDTTLLYEMLIRGFSGGGIRIPDGARPLHIRDVALLFNGGFGIDYTQVDPNLTQAVHLDNISGDGNLPGLMRFKNLDGSGSILLTNIKSERRVNPMFPNVSQYPLAEGGGGRVGQDSPLVFESCVDTPIAVHGLTHVSSIPKSPTFEPPGPAMVVRGTGTPRISWSAVAVRVRSNDAPATVKPAVLKDERAGGIALGVREGHGSYPIPRRLNDDSVLGAITTMPRNEITSDTVPLGTTAQPNNVIHLTYFTAPRDATITAIRTSVGDVASSGDGTLQSIGIMEVADNGDMTRLGLTGGTTMWTTAGGRSTPGMGTSVELRAGQRYAVALLVVGATTVPRFTGATAGNANELAESPRRTGQLTGASQIPATALGSAVTNTKFRIYTALVG
ncbi:tailspike protein [Gordonia phage Doggs]|nr:tailspike protein [Gordonia phage Doggs]